MTTTDRVSERDVEIAYQLMLGRPPETPAVVAHHVKSFASLADLRAGFLASPEFHDKVGRDLVATTALSKPLDWPRNEIEVDVAPDVLAAMIAHVERNWAMLGEREPHWSVLTADKFRAATIGNNIAEFYETGRAGVSVFTRAAERAGIDIGGLDRCFELGCGVGRLTVWLARLFPEVVAADISAPHLRLAAEALEARGLANVSLRHVNTIAEIEALPDFDCFVSIIVLQHNPPPVSAYLLRTALRKLRPGGLAYFQVPTSAKAASFAALPYLASRSGDGIMEMHVLPQATIWTLAREAGCDVVDVREDDCTGMSDTVSNSILLRKRLKPAN